MAKVALLTVHGMGETKQDYHVELLEALERKLGALFADVSVHRVYYQNLLQANEAAVWQACIGKVRYDALRKFLLFGFADAAGLENGKDDAASVYEMAQREIAVNLMAARDAVGAGGPVIAIAQSLGCQVFSSYLYDAQKAMRAREQPPRSAYPRAGLWQAQNLSNLGWDDDTLRFAAGGTIQALHTTGCNIPIFVAAHKRMQIIPIDKPSANFKWRNWYDPDDVLGWPLQPLANGYDTLVEDHVVNSGQGFFDWITKSWNPLSHTAYWTDDDVVEPLSKDLRALVG